MQSITRRILVCAIATTLASCASTNERSANLKHPLLSEDPVRVRATAFWKLDNFLGVWEGEGWFQLPNDLKTPRKHTEIIIGPELRGAGIRICEVDGESCSRIELIFSGVESDPVKVLSLSAVFQAARGETAVIESVSDLIFLDDGFSWTALEARKSRVVNDVIVQEASKTYYRYSYRKQSLSQIVYLIESSPDGMQWKTFYKADLKRKVSKL